MKRVLLIILFCLCIQNTYAQDGERRKKIKAYKIAFLTEKLDLTATEAEKFWPVYNQYHEDPNHEFSQKRRQLKKRINEVNGVENLSDTECSQIIKQMKGLEEMRHKNRTKFHQLIAEFLPPKKILKLRIAEHEFNKTLMRKLRDKKRSN